MSKHVIKTPHAAVLIWNYIDRVGTPNGDFKSSGVTISLDQVEKEPVPVIVSTLSCVSIQTSKAKGSPNGTFNLVLAPFKNWVGNLTPGSWCCILMSNKIITADDLKSADKDKVKMFGRIESVRCETKMNDNGTRQTLYYVSGTDWGDIFNSLLYVDNLIKGPNDKGNDQGDVAALALRPLLFGEKGAVKVGPTRNNLGAILTIMGRGDTLQKHTGSIENTGRLAGSIYEFALPAIIIKYFDFRDADGEPIKIGSTINKFLTLITGIKHSPSGPYKEVNEASGFVDPMSLQGTHSLWQILLENSNPALNEMLCDFKWNEKGPGVTLAIYNRIKPFAISGAKGSGSGASNGNKSSHIRAYFQNVKVNNIQNNEVISINAGTNWRDKINFIEIKPSFSEFQVVENVIKQKAQAFDPISFQREGFRALIVDTKQFPVKQGTVASSSGGQSVTGADWSQLADWVLLMREWYFGTHRMLNGTIVIHGSTPYIGIGENILFDAGLINPTPNINSASAKARVNKNILAHIESIQHNFAVDDSGARSYRTTISFVRGIVVHGKNNEIFGEGLLDQDVRNTSQHTDRNQLNTVSTSDIPGDPDPQKVRGT